MGRTGARVVGKLMWLSLSGKLALDLIISSASLAKGSLGMMILYAGCALADIGTMVLL